MISKEKFYHLYNKNSPLNKKRHIGPIDARLYLRNLSLPVAYFLAKRKVNPDSITFLFLGVSLIANILFIIPSIWTIFSLVLFLEISQLLDCVDGQLARYYNTNSKHGENLDTLAHILTSSTFMLAFGIRLYLQLHFSVFIVLGLLGGGIKALDHYKIITHSTILDNNFIKKISNRSKIVRYSVNAFQTLVSEIRFFGGFLLILAIIEKYIVPLPITELSFLILLIISIIENLVFPLVTHVTQIRHSGLSRISNQ